MNSINNQFQSKDMLEIIYTAEECEIDKRIKQVKITWIIKSKK